MAVISLVLPDGNIDANVYCLSSRISPDAREWEKIGYLTNVRKIRSLVAALQPDIISVHYASSYGTMAVFAGLKKFILSVWGSDVYSFPRRGALHCQLLKLVLRRAGRIFSTSYAMAKETGKYTNKKITVIPFGVDMELFNPRLHERNDNNFIIGTVKGLSPEYGIDTLLKAIAFVRQVRPDISLQCRIAGSGNGEYMLKELANALGINDRVSWLGKKSQDEAAYEWANFDCGIIPSQLESFGVAALEAQACGCPLIVSDAEGLLESTLPQITSMVIPRGDVQALAKAIIELYENPAKRETMGKAGIEFVGKHYDIKYCFHLMEIEMKKYKEEIKL